MTVFRYRNEKYTVLDFSDGTSSKNKIKKEIRSIQIRTLAHEESSKGQRSTYYIYNQIKIGMYTITLYPGATDKPSFLKEFDNIFIQIHEGNSDVPISLKLDGRFKNQYWCQESPSVACVHNIKIKTLVDIVKHCQRLNNLKAFL